MTFHEDPCNMKRGGRSTMVFMRSVFASSIATKLRACVGNVRGV